MRTVNEQRLIFKAVLATYYKTERNRAEECLADIITVLSAEEMPEADQIEQILDRLMKHYARQ